MFSSKLFLVESKRSLNELKRKPLSSVLGIILLFGAYFAAQRFPMLRFLSDQKNENGILIYFSWLFCLGTTLEISNGLCLDIASGVISKIVQSPYGIKKILKARFLVSAVQNSIIILIMIFAFLFSGTRIFFPSMSSVVILACISMQCYSVMLILAGLTLTQKSINSAYLVGISISVPLVFIPAMTIIGNFALILPLSGPLELLKQPNVKVLQLTILTLTSFLLIPVACYIFNIFLIRLKNNGRLLFV